MAVEDGCNGYLIAAELFGYVFEGEVFGCFGIEEGVGLYWKAVTEGALWVVISACSLRGGAELASRVAILVVDFLKEVRGVRHWGRRGDIFVSTLGVDRRIDEAMLW